MSQRPSSAASQKAEVSEKPATVTATTGDTQNATNGGSNGVDANGQPYAVDVEEEKPETYKDVTYADIFKQFVLLGWTAFGGPAAHIGLFQKIFVEKHKWMSAGVFTELLALGQCLPGPTSTQVSFAIGAVKKGISGGLLSGALFQYPGAIMMTALGYAAYKGLGDPKGALAGMAHGFGAAGVAMVAGAAVQLGKKLCNTKVTVCLATFAAVWAFYWPKAYVFPSVIIVGGLVTLYTERKKDLSLKPTDEKVDKLGISWPVGAVLIVLWAGILAAVISVRRSEDYEGAVRPLYWFETFFRIGSIIYGGGQVVLPLLFDDVCHRTQLPDGTFIDKPDTWVTTPQFLAGLGMVQAMPGPLFNFAAYLGTIIALRAGYAFIAGAALAWLGLFGPGILLIFGVLPFWGKFRSSNIYRRMLPGFNSTAVGLIFTSVMSMFLKLYLDPTLEFRTWAVCIMAMIYVFTEVMQYPAPLGVILGGVLGIIGWGANCF